jgi:hypothetical protein
MRLGATGNASPRHISAFESAPPIIPNWNNRKATTIVAPAGIEKSDNALAQSLDASIRKVKIVNDNGA